MLTGPATSRVLHHVALGVAGNNMSIDFLSDYKVLREQSTHYSYCFFIQYRVNVLKAAVVLGFIVKNVPE